MLALGRNSILAGALAAAVGIPVWMENSESPKSDTEQTPFATMDLENDPLWAGSAEFVPVNDYREIFNFSMNAQSIRARWAHVSTFPADDNLSALRVPLVTGTQEWDLQGSLTYYVDSDQRVRRILFRGWTGDANALIYFANEHLGFSERRSDSVGLYLQQQLFQNIGLLRVDQQNSIIHNHPGQKLAIVFEMNDPRSTLRLSASSSLLLNQAITSVSR